jgi:hypothetical protein
MVSKIGELEVAADYSEAKAAHEREVAQLNETIKADQATLSQLAEDARCVGRRGILGQGQAAGAGRALQGPVPAWSGRVRACCRAVEATPPPPSGALLPMPGAGT